MLYRELEHLSLAELIDVFRGPPIDGESGRASFFDDVAERIAQLGGADFLVGQLRTDDDDRLAAALGALGAHGDGLGHRAELEAVMRQSLHHPNPHVAAAAVDGLRDLGVRDARAEVVDLVAEGPREVAARGLIYLRVLFGTEAVTALRAALESTDATIRFTALDGLDELDVRDRSLFERMLEDPDEDVRELAGYVLAHHFGTAPSP